MKTAVVGVGWVATLVAAFLVGQMLTESAPDGGEGGAGTQTAEVERLEGQVESLREELAAARERQPRATTRIRDGGGAKAADVDRGRAGGGRAATGGDETDAEEVDPTEIPEAFSLEGMADAEQAAQAFMAFVDGQLGRGEAGYEAILRAMDQLFQEREQMQALFSDEAVATRQIYPFVKFLVEREEGVLDLTEYLFRTMAEEPQKLEYVSDDNVLEIFTEGMGIMLPGAVGEDRLAVFRGYAEKILETPAEDQPEAVRGNRNEMERLLTRFWAAPLTAEQALEKLMAGGVATHEITRLLRRVPADQLGGVDVTGLIEPLVREGNNDLLRVLSVLPRERLEMTRLDEALLEGMGDGQVHPWFASRFLSSTRDDWSGCRAFVDRAVVRDEKTAAAAVQLLVSYMRGSHRPDKAYVEDLLTRSFVNEQMAQQLRATYKIE